MSTAVRPPAVAGRFYPADPDALRDEVDRYLAAAHADAPAPKAVVAPHAGYVYSGPVAASAYATVAPSRGTVSRVVLLGPAHRVAFRGLAAPSVDAFRTPMGDVEVDADAREAVRALAEFVVDDRPHAGEHSLEVHLPFLQRVLGTFRVLPVVVGHASPETVAALLDTLWGGAETLIVVSTDLSHYEPKASADVHDRRTSAAVLAGDAGAIDPYDACGAFPLNGLLAAAARHGLVPSLLDLRTSADTAGDPDRVVGYGAFAFRPAS